MLGSPMIVGPVLAAALVAATYWLARTIAETSITPPLVEPVARTAALLSIVCAALRYHTADTMSHGASALGVTLALLAALRARRAAATTSNKDEGPFAGARGLAMLAGLAIGYVVCTRPASSLGLAIACVWLLRRRSLVLRAGLGLVPGVLLLLVSQHSVTGSWFSSSQRVYYALSDGPPGCFRWGFGAGTGCIFEHGDFVHARLEHGYGLVEALGTTLRRLRHHLMDVANLEPLALLALVPLTLRRGRKYPEGNVAIGSAAALVGLHVLAYLPFYLPFYFDGDYPGGGARLFADVLGVEHALVALGVAMLVLPGRDRPWPSPRDLATAFVRVAVFVLALALTGFSIHASYEHDKLRDRDGGRPMFEPDVLAHASLTSGLVFVDTDHGFALGHDPSARPSSGVVVARLRSDDRDRMLFEALDRPPTYLYKIEPPPAPGGEAVAIHTPWSPPEHGPVYRCVAEA
jgi:hypothetical protein